MARKNLLENLMKPADSADPPAPAKPRRSTGAIGAVSQSLADLKTRALTEVPADMIDNAGLTDRLDQDPEGIAALMDSIREYGQQVPVMLRHSPNYEGRYEIVYGRRRVLALKKLGLPVRAMVRDLNDRDLVVAQGQENAARKDLSFIEKANFARQMVDSGFERKVICDALHIDKTVISRMLTVMEAVPLPLIRAIGAAPSVGRDRWIALAGRIGTRPVDEITPLIEGDTSDTRFAALFDALAPKRTVRPGPEPLHGMGGANLGEVSRKKDRSVLTVRGKDGFDRWLVDNIDRIHREFLQEQGDRGE